MILQTVGSAAGALGSREVRLWARKGGAAVCEQACFAGSHFVLNVILARSLAIDTYGAFALSGTGLLVLIGFYNALMLEPASVLDLSRYEPRPSAYCRAQLVLHLTFSVLAAAVIVAIGFAVFASNGGGQLATALVSMGLASPFILLFWLARRFMYILGRPPAALVGSAAYLICICTAATWLQTEELLTPVTAFTVMGLASGVSATLMLRQAGVFRIEPVAERRFDRGALVSERWRYGRWMIGVVLAEIAVTPALVLMSTAMLSLGALGVLRAMQAFVLPMGHAVIAISAVALPALARDFEQGRLAALARKSTVLAGSLLTAALVIEVILIIFHPTLERILYGGKFAEYSFLIPLFGLVTILESLGVCYATVLSAVRQPSLIFRSVLITVPLSLSLGFVCISQWGLPGAVLSFMAAAGVAAGARRWFAGPWLSVRAEPI